MKIKTNFIGVWLSFEEYEKLHSIIRRFNELYEKGTNVSKMIRYLINKEFKNVGDL